jgi:peptidoglycan L-alanyl-D-glutamate endopeptidase CwlK
MGKILDSVDKELQDKAKQLIELCQKKNILINVTSGLRTLDEQNKLWRRAFGTPYILSVIENLRKLHCDYLAHSIERIGIQPAGRLGTRLHGGLSWHNWGRALDFSVQDHQGCIIKIAEHPLLKEFGTLAKSVGLRWGGDFSSPDPLHVQLDKKEIPTIYTMQQIDAHFKRIKG